MLRSTTNYRQQMVLFSTLVTIGMAIVPEMMKRLLLTSTICLQKSQQFVLLSQLIKAALS